MRRLALFTTLVLAASTGSAVAWPGNWPQAPDQDYDDAHDEGGVNRDRRDHDGDQHWSHDARGRWMSLARHRSAFSNQQIVLFGQGGPMRRLGIQADRGAPVVTRVTVEFMAGQTPQITTVNRRIPPGATEVIPLHRNRGVKRIIVYTEPRYGGAYSVFGA